MTFNPHQKPKRVDVRPGQKWFGADRSASAIVTSIRQVSHWGHEDEVTISFLRYAPGHEATIEQLPLAQFRLAFPAIADRAL